MAIPQVFSYSDNKSKLSDEISENAHPPAGVPQQTQVFGPGMTIDSKFYQGFSFIIKLLESFIVVYYTHQVYKPIAKVHQPVYKKPTNLGSNRFSLFQLFQLKLFVFGFTINSVFRRGREYIIVVLFELIEKIGELLCCGKKCFASGTLLSAININPL